MKFAKLPNAAEVNYIKTAVIQKQLAVNHCPEVGQGFKQICSLSFDTMNCKLWQAVVEGWGQ